ncbi:MAG: hypothetical protein IT536_16395 [Hyphomicrobiales bacterium]|nr:hypothetical protein [Hyphomicrobiales bacterium]
MDFRTLVLGLSVFCATFVVGWWLNIGGWLYPSRAPATALAAVAAPAQQEPAPPSSSSSRVVVRTGPTYSPPPSRTSPPKDAQSGESRSRTSVRRRR